MMHDKDDAQAKYPHRVLKPTSSQQLNHSVNDIRSNTALSLKVVDFFVILNVKQVDAALCDKRQLAHLRLKTLRPL